ncbi:MAG: formylglycine-generating enzyme family protein [Thermodesulfobacteriota bacterium]|nr:formylglycine-generating enzyme family protein [Thermodesulfobacteriota bacterium]
MIWILLLVMFAAMACERRLAGSSIEHEAPFTNSMGMTFVSIPPGTFVMGSPEDETGRHDDEHQCVVTLTKGFYCQTTEVTQGQWFEVMGNNPSHFQDCGDNCPVEFVSWNDCQEFIKQLNGLEGGNKYRLPTEAEWEYACRAGSQRAFAFGNIMETGCGHDPHLDAVGWYCGNSGKKPHPVARKRPNAFGLYDMHGNMWEWCQDWYDSYPSGPVTDPRGPPSGSGRVLRGGGWHEDAEDCRSAIRVGRFPESKAGTLGFRLVRTP